MTTHDRRYEIAQELWLPEGGEIRRFSIFPPFNGSPLVQLDRWTDPPAGAELVRRWVPTPSGAPAYAIINRDSREVSLGGFLTADEQHETCGDMSLAVGSGETGTITCRANALRQGGLFNFGVLVRAREPLASDVELETLYALHDEYYAE